MTMDEIQFVIKCVLIMVATLLFTIGAIAYGMIWLSLIYWNPKENKKQKEEKKNDEQ